SLNADAIDPSQSGVAIPIFVLHRELTFSTKLSTTLIEPILKLVYFSIISKNLRNMLILNY
ncbi:hypothetical protein, partial [Xenorhabdus vietnamensis]|uniref:hypothetical protein n=1 Tax=Xenorhabdus vietnamensis TaxID=351656 RepID=UPI001ABF307C